VVQGSGTRPLISGNALRENGGEAITLLDGAKPRLPDDGIRWMLPTDLMPSPACHRELAANRSIGWWLRSGP